MGPCALSKNINIKAVLPSKYSIGRFAFSQGCVPGLGSQGVSGSDQHQGRSISRSRRGRRENFFRAFVAGEPGRSYFGSGPAGRTRYQGGHEDHAERVRPPIGPEPRNSSRVAGDPPGGGQRPHGPRRGHRAGQHSHPAGGVNKCRGTTPFTGL